MDKKEHMQVASGVFENLGKTIENLKRCLFSRDKRLMNETKKAFAATVKASLPRFEEAVDKKEKDELDKRLLAMLPALQQLGIAVEDLIGGLETALLAEISFTDKALTEISEIMALVKDLARDTNDALTTENPHFRTYVTRSAQNILQRTDEIGFEHQKRLITGICSPRASFLYLDVMHSLKRIAQALSLVSETM